MSIVQPSPIIAPANLHAVSANDMQKEPQVLPAYATLCNDPVAGQGVPSLYLKPSQPVPYATGTEQAQLDLLGYFPMGGRPLPIDNPVSVFPTTGPSKTYELVQLLGGRFKTRSDANYASFLEENPAYGEPITAEKRDELVALELADALPNGTVDATGSVVTTAAPVRRKPQKAKPQAASAHGGGAAADDDVAQLAMLQAMYGAAAKMDKIALAANPSRRGTKRR